MGASKRDRRDVAGLSRRQCEQFFRRQGLPQLVDDHSVARDVYGRSAPFLLAMLLLELGTLATTQWTPWQNVLAAIGGLAIGAAAWIGLNLLRRRPWSTLPQSVGTPELAFFVLAPAIATGVINREWALVIASIVINLLILGFVRVLVGLGLLSTLGWGLARVMDELGSSLRRLVRLLPLVLIFSIVLFYNTEIWQVFDRISGQADIALGMFFLTLIIVLVSFGARREADAVIADAAHDASVEATTFTVPQRRNIVAMVATTQLLQVLVVSLATGVFFVVVGVLSITPEVREAWDIGGGTWHRTLMFGGADLAIDQTLIRVAVALATFNGLYYAINVQVDAVYRTELVEDITDQLHAVIHVRERYLVVMAQDAAAAQVAAAAAEAEAALDAAKPVARRRRAR